MQFVGLDQIKLEARIRHFDKKFTSLDEQKEYFDKHAKLDEVFIVDVLIHMLEYTCYDLKQHNEVVSSIDICRITCFNLIDIMKEKMKIDLTSMLLDPMQIFRYLVIVIAKAQLSEYKLQYLTDTIEKEMTPPPLEPIRTLTPEPILDSPKTEPERQIERYIEPYVPTLIVPVITAKTKKRLAGLMSRRPRS